MVPLPVVGLSALVTLQDNCQRVDSLLASRRAESSLSILISAYLLASRPELFDLLRHLVDSGEYLFVWLPPVIDHFPIVETVIKYGTDRTLGDQ